MSIIKPINRTQINKEYIKLVLKALSLNKNYSTFNINLPIIDKDRKLDYGGRHNRYAYTIVKVKVIEILKVSAILQINIFGHKKEFIHYIHTNNLIDKYINNFKSWLFEKIKNMIEEYELYVEVKTEWDKQVPNNNCFLPIKYMRKQKIKKIYEEIQV